MTQAYKDGVTKVAQAFGLSPASVLLVQRLQKKAADNSFGNTVSEVTGHVASPTILGVLGALATRSPIGFHLGAGVGSVGTLAGAIAAAVKARRSGVEQASYDSEGHVLKNLVSPGAGAYNLWKRVGRIIGNASEKKAEEQKQANLLALVKNVPKALQAAKAMRAAGALNAAPPVQMANKGLGQSVLGNLKNLMARSDAADNLTLGRRLMNADLKTLAQAKGRPFPPVKTAPKVPDGSIPVLSLKQTPSALPQQAWDHATPQAQQRKARLLEYLKRRFPGHENYGPF